MQKILSTLDEADDPDVIDYFEAMKNLPIHYDINEDKDQKELEKEEHTPEDAEDDAENSSDELFDEEQIQHDTNSSPLKKVS